MKNYQDSILHKIVAVSFMLGSVYAHFGAVYILSEQMGEAIAGISLMLPGVTTIPVMIWCLFSNKYTQYMEVSGIILSPFLVNLVFVFVNETLIRIRKK